MTVPVASAVKAVFFASFAVAGAARASITRATAAETKAAEKAGAKRRFMEFMEFMEFMGFSFAFEGEQSGQLTGLGRTALRTFIRAAGPCHASFR